MPMPGSTDGRPSSRIISIDAPLSPGSLVRISEASEERPPAPSLAEAQPTVDPVVSQPLASPDVFAETPALGPAVASEGSPTVDRSVMSGVIEFITESRLLPRAKEAGNSDELHGKEVKKFDREDIEKELDSVLDSMGALLTTFPQAAKHHWICHWCEEESRIVRASCNNCGRNRCIEDGSQRTDSRRSSEESDAKEDYTDSRSSEDVSQCAEPGSSEDGDVKDDDGEAACSRAGETHWLCQYCAEENRAVRTWCNNCSRVREQCSPSWCNIATRRTMQSGCDDTSEESVGSPRSPGVVRVARSPGVVRRARTEERTRSRSEEKVDGNEYDAEVTFSEDTESHWTCVHCDEQNRAIRAFCNNCGSGRGQREDAPSASKVNGHSESEQRAGACSQRTAETLPAETVHWTCPQCDEVNRACRSQCHNCEHPKEDVGASKPSPYESPWPWTPSHQTNRGAYASPWPHTERAPRAEAVPEHGIEPSSWVDSAVSGLGPVHEDNELAVSAQHVILHIYDVFADDRVQAVNDVFRTVGTGAFHAGVEVFGQEWSYGYTPCSTGLVVCNPKSNPAHRYREAIVMGTTSLSEIEVDNLLEEMAKEWQGLEYDLLLHNCCHFCDAFCIRLGVGPLPVWVTNLAGVGARLVDGVTNATVAVNGIVDAAAERAAELDKRYNILSTMDSFTTREITIDETYLESRVQSLWTQAVQNIENVSKNIETVGMLAGRAMDEVPKPVQISSTFSKWWSWGPESRSKALSESQTAV